jgi:hypothetical protein
LRRYVEKKSEEIKNEKT